MIDSAISAIVTQNGWLLNSFCTQVRSAMPATSEMRA